MYDCVEIIKISPPCWGFQPDLSAFRLWQSQGEAVCLIITWLTESFIFGEQEVTVLRCVFGGVGSRLNAPHEGSHRYINSGRLHISSIVFAVVNNGPVIGPTILAFVISPPCSFRVNRKSTDCLCHLLLVPALFQTRGQITQSSVDWLKYPNGPCLILQLLVT